MKSLSFLALCLFSSLTLPAQLAPELKNLEGIWYQSGRTAACYSIWTYSGENTFENQTFTILCGDTIEQSRATVASFEGAMSMTLRTDSTGNSQVQVFRLARLSGDEIFWQNANPEGTPQQLAWIFHGSSYATFRADGLEVDFRRKRLPMKILLRVSAGANLSTFAGNRSPHEFLALQNVAFTESSHQRLPGQEIAVSAGLLFRETPLRLFFELWVARRQVGVQARFVTEQGGYARHGVYDYFNTSFALVPEVFLDKKQRLALSTGFYFDLAQQRSYRGDRASPSSNATFADPRQDIDRERGVLAGVSYRISFLEKWQPTMYVRHTFGLNDTRVRAISLGLSFQLGKK